MEDERVPDDWTPWLARAGLFGEATESTVLHLSSVVRSTWSGSHRSLGERQRSTLKLITYVNSVDQQPRVGTIAGDGSTVIDLRSASAARDSTPTPTVSDMLALLDAGQRGLDEAQALVDFAERQRPPDVIRGLSDIELLSPVPRPRSIRDCMAFEQHLVQCMRTVVKWKSPPLAALDRWLDRSFGRGFLRVPQVWREQPIYYKGNPHSVVGHKATVYWPSYTNKLDYELEFGVYIGRQGRDINVDDARDYIAGYTIFNDFSARDTQLREMAGKLGPAKGKDFDTGNAIGPWLVTPDEIAEPNSLTMIARVNGEEWSRGNSSDMHFSFEEMISYISQCETLYPGDFIGSGTAPGGCGLELDRWLSPGDVVELEVDGVGVLENRVDGEPTTPTVP